MFHVALWRNKSVNFLVAPTAAFFAAEATSHWWLEMAAVRVPWQRSAGAAFRRLQAVLQQGTHYPHSMSSFAVGVSRVYSFKQLPLEVESGVLSDAEQGSKHAAQLSVQRTASQPALHVLTEHDVANGAMEKLLGSLSGSSSDCVDLVVPVSSVKTFLRSSDTRLEGAADTEHAQLVHGNAADKIEVSSLPIGDSLVAGTQPASLAHLDERAYAALSAVGSLVQAAQGRGAASTLPHTTADSTPPVLPGEGSFLFDDNEGASGGGQASQHSMPPHTAAAFRCAEAGDTQGLCAHLDSLSASQALSAASAPHPRHGGSLLHVLAASAAALDAESFAPGLHKLLACGAHVNALAANGSTPLHWAAGAGHEDAVRGLLGAGADACAVTYVWRRQLFGKGSGQTPLHWAAESGHTHVIRLLLEGVEGGAQGGAVPGWRGGSAPLVGAFSASPQVAAALMPDERGVTAGELASKSGFKAAGDAIAAVTGLPMVRLRVSVAGQRVVSSTHTQAK